MPSITVEVYDFNKATNPSTPIATISMQTLPREGMIVMVHDGTSYRGICIKKTLPDTNTTPTPDSIGEAYHAIGRDYIVDDLIDGLRVTVGETDKIQVIVDDLIDGL